MKINELKNGDRIRYQTKQNTIIGYSEYEGIIEHIEPSSENVKIRIISGHEYITWINKEQIISKIEETPIEHPLTFEFEFQPYSVSVDISSSRYKANVSTRVSGYSSAGMINFDTPYLLNFNPSKKYKIKIEEMQ